MLKMQYRAPFRPNKYNIIDGKTDFSQVMEPNLRNARTLGSYCVYMACGIYISCIMGSEVKVCKICNDNHVRDYLFLSTNDRTQDSTLYSVYWERYSKK